MRLIALGAALQACALITDFDVEPSSSTSSASTGGGAVGGAGGMSFDAVDFETDEDNCGSCGFACGSSPCENGRCSESIDLSAQGGDIISLLVQDDTVFIVQRNGPDPDSSGTLWTLPTDFTSTSTAELGHPLENAIGTLVAGSIGTHRIYFAGQLSKVIYACNESECLEVSLGAAIQSQVNGMTAVDDVLYVIAAAGDNRLLSLPLDPTTGAPAVRPTYLVTSYSPAIPNAGVLELYHLRSPTRLYWGTFSNAGLADGCIYRIETDNVPASPLACWSPTYIALGFVVAADGTVFAQNGMSNIDEISGEPPMLTPFASNATYPRAIDADYLYVTNSESQTVRALPLAGGSEAPETPVPPANLTTLTASDPRYLYYAAVGATLLRSPKPPSR